MATEKQPPRTREYLAGKIAELRIKAIAAKAKEFAPAPDVIPELRAFMKQPRSGGN